MEANLRYSAMSLLASVWTKKSTVLKKAMLVVSSKELCFKLELVTLSTFKLKNKFYVASSVVL